MDFAMQRQKEGIRSRHNNVMLDPENFDAYIGNVGVGHGEPLNMALIGRAMGPEFLEEAEQIMEQHE